MLALVLTGCGSEAPDAETDQAEAESGESETGEEPAAIGDACETTPVLLEAPTTIELGLRHATPGPEALAEACPGLTGPMIYAEATVHGRADLTVATRGRGFTPRFVVMLPGCSADPSRVLACGDALPVTLPDLGPDLELLIAIAATAEEPALTSEAPEEGAPDPLDVELRLEVRPVLAEGDRCGPAFGRCEAGTVCLLDEDADGAVERCRRPLADSCAAPGTLALAAPGEEIVLEIPGDEPHSDAHEHPCTGWRRPERVDRLELPAGLGEGAILRVEADDPRVGLALRGPDCAPEHALACAPATGAGDGTVLEFATPGQLAGLAAAGEAPRLFIELPSADPPETLVVRVRVDE